MSSIFTKIIAGEIPSYKIAEDEQHLAFLDAIPLVKGHTLVIPKKETDFIFDLENEDFKKAIEDGEKLLADRGRILVRPSGTEALIRIMAEGENIEEIEKLVRGIAKKLR